MLAASCGLGAANHNRWGAATPVLTQATKPPAVELIEFFQCSNEPDTTKPCSHETEKSPFLDSLLTTTGAAGKQQKAKYFWASAARGNSWAIGS
jgi:hypothetical protein